MRRLERLFIRSTTMNNEKIEDGIYVEFFAVKDGERYNAKIVSIKEIATTLTGSLMDGIESLVKL
jgi:hypothetical protein